MCTLSAAFSCGACLSKLLASVRLLLFSLVEDLGLMLSLNSFFLFICCNFEVHNVKLCKHLFGS